MQYNAVFPGCRNGIFLIKICDSFLINIPYIDFWCLLELTHYSYICKPHISIYTQWGLLSLYYMDLLMWWQERPVCPSFWPTTRSETTQTSRNSKTSYVLGPDSWSCRTCNILSDHWLAATFVSECQQTHAQLNQIRPS